MDLNIGPLPTAERLYQNYRSDGWLGALALDLDVLELLGRAKAAHARKPAWLAVVIDLLHDKYITGIRASDLAVVAGVHPVHLGRSFRLHIGCSIPAYLSRLRLQHACGQLRWSSATIASIAAATGFVDQSHLTRTCRAALGVTPAEYRRKCRSAIQR